MREQKGIGKRMLTLMTACVVLLGALAGCQMPAGENTDKLTVTATLFASYDFAREIAGDRAQVSLLLPPGVESHAFEPTPADIIQIGKSDLFLYTGKYMESWVEGIVENLKRDNVAVVDLSEGIALATTQQVAHDHLEADTHTEGGEQSDGETTDQIYDPHIWTDPQNAIIMARHIAQSMCDSDPENAAYYTANCDKYVKELEQLDTDIQTMVQSSRHKKIIFGGKFAMYYFARRYGLEYEAAYDTCSGQSEPSARRVAELIEQIRQEGLSAVYYEELSEPRVANSIAQEAGVEALLLHSCHNVSKDEMQRGETYLSLMRQNLENLKKGLNGK